MKNASFATGLFSTLIIVSVLALGLALTSQFAYGLAPCELCLYQRMPYLGVIAAALIGLALRKKPARAAWISMLCALLFLLNAGIAAYHTGVERQWWASAAEGCKVPSMGHEDTADWIEKMLSRPSVPCGEIQWADPFIGLTMANYNGLLCIELFALCLFGFSRLLRNAHRAQKNENA